MAILIGVAFVMVLVLGVILFFYLLRKDAQRERERRDRE